MPKSHGSDIDVLIQLLAKLPGLGPRSARRSTLQLLKKRESVMLPLSDALRNVADSIRICTNCGNIDTSDPCHVCIDARRDQTTVCVVEDVADLWALDRSETYRGLYHVLGGTLSALDGIGPDDLNIDNLVARAASGGVKEVILALNATVDGQTTSHYLAERLSDFDIKVTALAHGVPVGGELDYLDDGTLAAALKARGDVT
ncbi:recombination mediator RecR [Kordiimonas sp. SCSIO 12610]|uniref:recombination mediator RecR n=1 Tax=Kordiimonas sp. SCSIO 12610 TaxID=2829597 RepID=UPI00210885BB|nr:recombination mediator RecR [Kordiimonas sp. SCSIO 12610]UTW55183.1 recombination mediator RecR [Kordiimonas sp. SCSIO 12610]